MTKRVDPASFGFDEPISQLLKVATSGLKGDDRRAFFKRAGDCANVFLPHLGAIKFASGEVPVHMIALGSREAWSANRNGDAFCEAGCVKYAHTFEQFARFYRDHKNRTDSPFYGEIKKAAYNPAMKRVELLIGLFGTKAAAERKGGRVAERELEKLARGEDLAGSMSCRIPYDECSFCHNKAATRDDYCTAATCGAGGCRDNLTRVVKVGSDLHHLYVDNDHPCWFDYSDVHRPADPTAYGNRADWLQKAAAAGYDPTRIAYGDAPEQAAPLGLVLYQEALVPSAPQLAARIKLAQALAALESRGLDCEPALLPALAGRALPVLDPALHATAEKRAALAAALADEAIVLPFGAFARLAGKEGPAKRAAALLPGIFGRMIAAGTLERALEKDAFAPAEGVPPLRARHAAAQLAPDFALTKSAAITRAARARLRQLPPPSVRGETKAAGDPEALGLAEQYAAYALGALARMPLSAPELLLTARFVTTQNRLVEC